MPVTLAWPSDLPLFDEVEWTLIGSTPGPGLALSGREQFLWRENRSWRGRLTLAPLRRDRIMALRALGDELRGRYGRVAVPVCNRYTRRYSGDLAAFLASAGVSAPQQAAGGLTFSDGASFDDGALFALPSHEPPVARQDTPAGAVLIDLDGFLGTYLAVGAYFSHDGYLYRVSANAGGSVRFAPPLRAAIAAGARVEVSAPVIVVRLAGDDGLRVPDPHGRLTGKITVEVMEAFDR